MKKPKSLLVFFFILKYKFIFEWRLILSILLLDFLPHSRSIRIAVFPVSNTPMPPSITSWVLQFLTLNDISICCWFVHLTVCDNNTCFNARISRNHPTSPSHRNKKDDYLSYSLCYPPLGVIITIVSKFTYLHILSLLY